MRKMKNHAVVLLAGEEHNAAVHETVFLSFTPAVRISQRSERSPIFSV